MSFFVEIVYYMCPRTTDWIQQFLYSKNLVRSFDSPRCVLFNLQSHTGLLSAQEDATTKDGNIIDVYLYSAWMLSTPSQPTHSANRHPLSKAQTIVIWWPSIRYAKAYVQSSVPLSAILEMIAFGGHDDHLTKEKGRTQQTRIAAYNTTFNNFQQQMEMITWSLYTHPRLSNAEKESLFVRRLARM